MDTSKLGAAYARALDDIERFVENGDVADDAEVGAVVLIVALDSKTRDDHPDRHLLRSVATQCFVFAEPEQLYVQYGLIELARNSYAPEIMEDDEQ